MIRRVTIIHYHFVFANCYSLHYFTSSDIISPFNSDKIRAKDQMNQMCSLLKTRKRHDFAGKKLTPHICKTWIGKADPFIKDEWNSKQPSISRSTRLQKGKWCTRRLQINGGVVAECLLLLLDPRRLLSCMSDSVADVCVCKLQFSFLPVPVVHRGHWTTTCC